MSGYVAGARPSIRFVSSARRPWGAEHSLALITNELVQDCVVSIVCYEGEVAEFFRSATSASVVAVPPPRRGRVSELIAAVRDLRHRERVDATVVFSLDLLPLGWLLRTRAQHGLLAVDIHDTPTKLITRSTMRVLLRGFDVAIAISLFSAESARGARRRAVVRRPTLSTGLPPREHNAAMPLAAAIVGRIDPEKRIELLIDAVRGLEATVHVFGAPYSADDEYYQQLIAYGAQELGDRFIYHGQQPKDKIYEQVDVVVVGNDVEPNGRTVGEAMDRGVVPVVPSTGGAVENIEPGVTGIVYEARSVEALRAALRELGSDRAMLERMAAEAQEAVTTERRPAAIAERYLRALVSRIADRPAEREGQNS